MPVNLLGTHPLGGTRFRIRGRLGAGSMGVVYEAHDRERDEVVALKTLLHAEANALYRFKREFRALADIHHRNLVALHELLVDEQQCFFTMERVVGCTFLEYVRPEHGPATDDPTFEGLDPEGDTGDLGDTRVPGDDPDEVEESQPADSLADASLASDGSFVTDATLARDLSLGRASLLDASLEPETPPTRAASEDRPTGGAVDLARLRNALGQLAEGVVALHQAGIVHRDLKPSNVMVTEDGRVVILDFGLATELTRPGAPEAEEDGLTGTAAYMAPEQVAHGRGVAASDWYAVGVMLYEALAGVRPYTGALLQVLLAKRQHDPPPLAQVAPHAPHDLAMLCEMLLRRDPATRPGDADVLRLLGRATRDAGSSGSGQIPRGLDAPLVGRTAHLQALRDAFAATARGQAVTVYVHGPSGAGKSALVRGFLDELTGQDPRPVILSGRCYLRESVPYKALDPVVDSLSRFLNAMPEEQARVLMPRDLWALARLFPVMQTVVDNLHGRGPAAAVLDQVELRRRAFAALRELLGRLADRRRVVITIDDLQWADADSSALLDGLLRPPDAPALLLLASFRSEEIDHQPFLRELLAQTGTAARRELAV
ncbi:MAG TPA: protein kinase, partial [Nannocystis sp.]